MAVTEEITYGLEIGANDTFADRIGAIESVKYASAREALRNTFQISYNKQRQAVEESSSSESDKRAYLSYAEYVLQANIYLVERIIEIMAENNDDIKDYIISYSQMFPGISRVGSAFQQYFIHLIHKDDFIALCSKWNDNASYVNNVLDWGSAYGAWKFRMSNSLGDNVKYTFIHNKYRINKVDAVLNQNTLNVGQFVNYVTENMLQYSAGTEQYLRNSMSDIFIGFHQYPDNTYLTYSLGTYDSSIKTFGQPESEPGGGDGEQDNESDSISVPRLPSITLLSTQFGKIYNPNLTQIVQISHYLWDSDNVWKDFWQDIEKKFTHPQDAIMGLFLSNVAPQGVYNGDFKVGGKVFRINGETITVPIISDQYIEVDCGVVDIKPYWKNFLDYNPYTNISLYLPFIGEINIDTDEFMGKQMGIKYHIDLATGACQVYVSLIDNTSEYGNYEALKYVENGNCFMQLPVTSGNYQEFLMTTLKAAIAGAAVGVTAGSVAAVGSAAGGISSLADLGAAKTLAKEAGAGLALSAGDAAKGIAVGAGAGLIGATASATKGAKDKVQKSGSSGSALPLMCPKKPYLTISRPNQSLPENYAHFKGFPSNITSSLNSLSGYTEVEFVRIENISATDEEKSLIEQALYKGVIL